MFYIEDKKIETSRELNFNILKKIIREIICVALCFGHEYKRVGNQHTKYLKCVKCGKVI